MTDKPAIRGEIVEEIHKYRREVAEKFDGDIAAIFEDARKRQEASGRPIWQGPQREPTKRERPSEVVENTPD